MDVQLRRAPTSIHIILIKKSHFRALFPDSDGVLAYVPGSGSISDQFIEMATLSLLRKWKIPFEIVHHERLLQAEKLPARIKRIFIAGGGEMGSFYAQAQQVRIQAVKTGRPVTILPQSFTDADEDVSVYDKIWVRERESQAVCPSAALMPDLALSARLDSRRKEIRKSTAVYLRQDAEALFPDHVSSFGDPAILGSNVSAYLDLIAPYKHIITDRLNFAIAALLMKRKVTLLPNAYYKNRSTWESYLDDLGCHWADEPDRVKVCRNKRVNRKIPLSDDLRIAAKDVIYASSDWHQQDHHGQAVLSHDNRHLPLSDQRQQQLWQLLGTGISLAALKQAYTLEMNGQARDAGFDLNQRLRALFNAGAISIHSSRNKMLKAGLSVKGESGQLPLEIHPFRPFRLNDDVYICADITIKGKRKTAWYRVDAKYRHFIHESADPFVLSFLQRAMRNHSPVWVREGTVSSGLLRNLQQFQRVWALWHEKYTEIRFMVEDSSIARPLKSKPSRCAITSFSGGVDSTFTLFNHTQNTQNHYKYDLRYAMLGHGFDIPLEDEASFQSVYQQCKYIAGDAGIELIAVASNIRQFDFDWEQGHVSVVASCMHLLSNGFHTGLVPSTLNYGVVYPWGSTPMTDCMHSSDTMRIETDGADITRVEKIEAIKGWEVGIQNIRFCWIAQPYDHNCGRCGKCTLTAIMLQVTGASKKSIRPFPNGKRIDRQLDDFGFSRLDRSDFRNHLEIMKKMKPTPLWMKKFLRKIEQDDQ